MTEHAPTPDDAGHLRIGPGNHDRAFVLAARGSIQSYVDLADPTHLEFPYIQRIGEVVDLAGAPGQPLRLVHIGGSGMTIPRYAEATRPGSVQLVFEPDEWAAALVLGHVPLPSDTDIELRVIDGRAGLADLPADCADVVVLDAFDGAVVPPQLTSSEAFAEIARVLRPGGLLAANLADRAPFTWTRRAVAAMATAFPQVVLVAAPSTLDGERFGNLVFVASPDRPGDAPLPVDELRRRAEAGDPAYRFVGERDVRAQFGPAMPFTDADPEL